MGSEEGEGGGGRNRGCLSVLHSVGPSFCLSVHLVKVFKNELIHSASSWGEHVHFSFLFHLNLFIFNLSCWLFQFLFTDINLHLFFLYCVFIGPEETSDMTLTVIAASPSLIIITIGYVYCQI